MSNRDIKFSDLGPHPFLRIAGPTPWNATRKSNHNIIKPIAAYGSQVSPSEDSRPPLSSPPVASRRDFNIDLSLSSMLLF